MMLRRTAVRSLAALLVAPLLASAVACSDSTAPLVGIDDVTYASSLGVNLAASTRTASGLAYRDVQVGTGAVAASGTAASVRYTGRVASGAEFDSNVNAASPLVVAIGNSATGIRTVPGFEEGITGMRVGGRRQLVIPPALAYGRTGQLGNQVLVFDVELVAVQ